MILVKPSLYNEVTTFWIRSLLGSGPGAAPSGWAPSTWTRRPSTASSEPLDDGYYSESIKDSRCSGDSCAGGRRKEAQEDREQALEAVEYSDPDLPEGSGQERLLPDPDRELASADRGAENVGDHAPISGE